MLHKNEAQAMCLLRCLDYTCNDIYIHIDASSSLRKDKLENTCVNAAVHFVDSVKVNWGGVSIVHAEMLLLAEATKTEHVYYHLLSGMDMPLKSSTEIQDFFAANPGKEYVESHTPSAHSLMRVNYPTLFPEGSLSPLTNLANHIWKYLHKLAGNKINKDVSFHSGSQWFSITHGFASFVVSRADWVNAVFNRTTLCDEFFIQTLLHMSPFAGNQVNNNMRLIEMGGGKSSRHPKTYTMADWEQLMASPQLWARKFDQEVDNQVIQELTKLNSQHNQ